MRDHDISFLHNELLSQWIQPCISKPAILGAPTYLESLHTPVFNPEQFFSILVLVVRKECQLFFGIAGLTQEIKD
jgi:hypothetical protein